MKKNDSIEGAELYAVVGKIYEMNRDKSSISPAWLATQGMDEIKFPRKLHDLGYIGCHLQLRQIAREFCREKCDPVDAATAMNDLFPETLQERYPKRPQKGDEPEYLLLDQLADDDIDYNIVRMRRASFALQKHSDALEAFKRDRKHAA